MSAEGHSFTFNNVDYANYGVYIVDRSWPRLPQPRVNFENYAQAHGGASQGTHFEARRIKQRCVLVGSDGDDTDTKAANLAAAIAACHAIGLCPLVFDQFPTLEFDARITSGLDIERALNGEIFTLEWLCPDPWPHASSTTTETALSASTGTPVSVTAAGSAPADASYVFKDGGSGGSSVVFTNAATGETATWANALPAGAWLRLDSASQTFEVSENSGGSWTSIPSNSTGLIPRLSGGEANNLTITGPSGTFDVTYTARYLQ